MARRSDRKPLPPDAAVSPGACFYPEDPLAYLVERVGVLEWRLARFDERLARIERVIALLQAATSDRGRI